MQVCTVKVRAFGMLHDIALLCGWMLWSVMGYAQSPVYVEAVRIPINSSATNEGPIAAGYDLATLIAIAEANHPRLRRAAAEVDAAQGRWLQVGLAPNPYLGYNGQQIASRGLAEQQGVIFGQQIVTGGKLKWNREVAAREVEKARQDYRAECIRLRTEVALHFYEVVTARQRAEIIRELIRSSHDTITLIESQVRAREATRIEVLQAMLAEENRHLLGVQADNREATAWRELMATIGMPQEPPQVLQGKLEDAPQLGDWNELITQLEACSPELAKAQAEVRRSRSAYERAEREKIPNLDFQGIVQRDEGVNGNDGAVVLTMPLPIFNRNQGGIREANANICVAQEAVNQLRLELGQRLAGVVERYLSAQQQSVHYTRDILPAAEEQVQLVSQAIKAGESNYTVLLSAQRTLAEAKLGLLELRRAQTLAAVEIQGFLLRESHHDGK